MPSPFPGMDPYLESPDWFPDLHDGMIFSIKEGLQALLPRSYYARSRQRVWLGLEHRDHVEPDVDVLRSGGREATPEATRDRHRRRRYCRTGHERARRRQSREDHG